MVLQMDSPVVSVMAPTRTLGRSWGPLTGTSRCATVRVDVIVAVRTDTMIIANSIQINATTRPPKVIGALSP
jgi:hypothetical protein